MSANRTLPLKPAEQQALQNALTGAAERIHAGDLDAAAKLLQASQLALKNPVGMNILGDIRLRQGNPREALRAFESAVKLAPAFPEAHCNRGVALQELGRLDEALAAEDKALRHRPGFATAHYNRGNILRDLGRLDEAIAAYDRAVKAKPALAEARLNRGMALIEKNRLLEALADFRQAVSVKPDLVAALIGQATVHRKLGQKKEALAAIEAALKIEPDDPELSILKSRLLVSMARYQPALEIIDRLLATAADNPIAHTARASVLCRLKRFDEALAATDRAIAIAPKDPEAHAARAVTLSELGRVEEQLDALKIAEELGAANADFHHARATALADFGDLAEAAAAFEQAIALDPDSPVVHHHYGMLLLLAGDFERGWRELEWRLKDVDYKDIDRKAVAPDWRGESLDGKKILVKHEQGHGDNIQFARFLPALTALNAKVTLTVAASLNAIFHRAFPEIDVTNAIGMRRGFDYQVALMSLPQALATGAETLSQSVPYLCADEALVAKWRQRLGGDGLKVGIAWQGNPKYGRDRFRSIPLARYQPLAAVPGVRLISVQAINGLDQLDRLPPGMTVESFGAEVGFNPDGIDEVAAIMANLDLVVSSDTVTIHLAGALGRPAWVALRDRPDWRWRDAGDATPWYPTVRLFRQPRHGDWESVFSAIAEALREEIRRKG